MPKTTPPTAEQTPLMGWAHSPSRFAGDDARWQKTDGHYTRLTLSEDGYFILTDLKNPQTWLLFQLDRETATDFALLLTRWANRPAQPTEKGTAK